MTDYLDCLNKLPRYRATVEQVNGRYEGTMRKSKNGPYVLLTDVVKLGANAAAAVEDAAPSTQEGANEN